MGGMIVDLCTHACSVQTNVGKTDGKMVRVVKENLNRFRLEIMILAIRKRAYIFFVELLIYKKH